MLGCRLTTRPILTQVGITSPAQQVGLLSGLNMFGFAIVLFVSTQLVERVGRRPIWLWSIGLQTICFVIFTALSVSNRPIP
jgi:MFS family permease